MTSELEEVKIGTILTTNKVSDQIASRTTWKIYRPARFLYFIGLDKNRRYLGNIIITFCDAYFMGDIITYSTVILMTTHGRHDEGIGLCTNPKLAIMIHHPGIIITCGDRPKQPIRELQIQGDGTHFKDSTVADMMLDDQLASFEAYK